MMQRWLGGLSIPELIRRTARESWRDAVFGQAGRMAFYHLLAVFPALLMLRVASDWLGIGGGVRTAFLEACAHLIPGAATDTVHKAAQDMSRVPLPLLRTLGAALGAAWAGCNGTWAMIYGLNTAYEVEEGRTARQLAVTIGALTLALAFISIAAMSVVAAAAAGRQKWGMNIPLGAIEAVVFLAVLLIWFSILYRFAPSVRERTWMDSTPGAITAAVLWVVITAAANFYFEHVDDYRLSYGRFNGIVMLLLWLYATNSAILIGGEMNSEIRKATHKQPTSK